MISYDEIASKIQKERGGVAEVHSSFKDFPQGVHSHYEFYKDVIIGDDLPLSRLETEFLAVETSQANTCPYCVGHHKEALDNYKTQDLIPSKKEILSKLALCLTKEPWKSSVLKDKFLSTGYSEAQWNHALFVVSYFNFVNRLVHAQGLELEENFQDTCK